MRDVILVFALLCTAASIRAGFDGEHGEAGYFAATGCVLSLVCMVMGWVA